MHAIFKSFTYKNRSGSKVEVLSSVKMNEKKHDMFGGMWRIRFADGFEMLAFDDELTFKRG